MALSAKQKRVKARLEEIQQTAQGYALNPSQTDPLTSANLAEEAAALALEVLQGKED